jgi:predicted ester cyclase
LLGRPATHKRLSANAVFIYRVQHGRIAEAWQMIDGLAFFRLAGFLSELSAMDALGAVTS